MSEAPDNGVRSKRTWNVPLVIPSHKRAGEVTTHRHVADCLICVPESQMDDYLKHHDEQYLVPHPDSVIGLNQKRQWIMDKFDERVFQLDDDVQGLCRVWRPAGAEVPAKVDPLTVRELIDRTEEVAIELGVYVYAFGTHANPRVYSGLTPFKLSGAVAGAIGMRPGSKLFYPVDTMLPLEDYWLALLNAYYHRILFRDLRFGWMSQTTFKGRGGLAEFRRGWDTEKQVTEWLRRKFGPAVQWKERPPSNVVKNANPYGRKIALPYYA